MGHQQRWAGPGPLGLQQGRHGLGEAGCHPTAGATRCPCREEGPQHCKQDWECSLVSGRPTGRRGGPGSQARLALSDACGLTPPWEVFLDKLGDPSPSLRITFSFFLSSSLAHSPASLPWRDMPDTPLGGGRLLWHSESAPHTPAWLLAKGRATGTPDSLLPKSLPHGPKPQPSGGPPVFLPLKYPAEPWSVVLFTPWSPDREQTEACDCAGTY